MTRKAKAAPPTKPTLTNEQLTRVACNPIYRSASTLVDYGKHFGDLDLGGAVDVLNEHAKAVHGGDTKRIETMLATQADALDAIFGHLAHRAALNAGEYLGAMETYMKLALRAQSQCRATLETLATIKNPPNVAFVRQANIANGPQQVNNGNAEQCESFAIARAGTLQNQPSELLEAPHGKPQWMDARTAGTATAGDPPLATVATIERAKNP